MKAVYLLLLLSLAVGFTVARRWEYWSCSDVPVLCRSDLCDTTRSWSRLWNHYTGIDIMTHGVGSPLPMSDNRYATGFVLPDGSYFLIDAGTGIARDLGTYKCQDWTVKVRNMALTHYHSDHTGDIGPILNLGFVNGRRGAANAVQLYGPQNLNSMASALRTFYAPDAYARQTVFHAENMTCSHASDPSTADSLNFVAHEFTINSASDIVPLFSAGGVSVSAIAVPHVSIYPSVGYVLESADVKIVVSGDTTPSEMVEAQAIDADYLIHEVLNGTWTMEQYYAYVAEGNPKAGSFYCNVPGAHTSIEDLAALAQRARVKNLIISHQVPIMDADALYQAIRNAGFTCGELFIANDGDYWKVLKDN